MPEHFVNDGYGWTCGRCGAETQAAAPAARPSEKGERGRFFQEGEAEEREGAALASPSLARWRDEGGRRVLFCPVCGVEEEFKTEG